MTFSRCLGEWEGEGSSPCTMSVAMPKLLSRGMDLPLDFRDDLASPRTRNKAWTPNSGEKPKILGQRRKEFKTSLFRLRTSGREATVNPQEQGVPSPPDPRPGSRPGHSPACGPGRVSVTTCELNQWEIEGKAHFSPFTSRNLVWRWKNYKQERTYHKSTLWTLMWHWSRYNPCPWGIYALISCTHLNQRSYLFI